MIQTFKYPLYPTKAQAAVFEAWLGVCQQLYNAALQERRDAWRKQRVRVTRFDQFNQLTEIRREDKKIAAISVEVLRSAVARCDRSFQRFFRCCERREKSGFPRFRSRDRYTSFSFPFMQGVRIEGNKILIPKLGPVRFHHYRPLGGTPREVTIGKEVGKWYVSISCDLGEAPSKIPVRDAVGVDLGLNNFAVLSTGESIENPRYFRRGEAVLARRQRTFSGKVRGTSSRARAKLLVQKAHQHVANQRLDHARKLAAHLFDRFDLVVHEDLKISGMVRGHFAKSINDAAWGRFIRCLASKAESAGKHLIAVDPRGTTQRCSSCQTVVPKTLAERIHSCPSCGLTLGRDHNAAINILSLAPGRGVVSAEGST